MTKQLDDMWSSKWVLPEHREALIEDDRSLIRTTKPELDEQEILLIDQVIQTAYLSKEVIILTVYSNYEIKTITGTVFKIENMLKMVKIKLEEHITEHDECVWLHMREILKAELKLIEEWFEGEIDW